ncbi:diguanylate cyclase [Trinickia terrae]|uniref:diguanylate cyclase n=1 Tax=Trinickia terrae TaxID=2571161 RepID=A0A4U1HJV4_9BURK|nr:diguanylate cyclase [Trinickia terrae]TKC81479.1 diguanylate cyclase [Trinickia terrae]
MSSNIAASAAPIVEPPAGIRYVTQIYGRLLLVGFALIPAYLVAYLYFFQDPSLKFENHLFHEIAIAAATLEGLFVTYVTWQCYRLSGEPILRWLTLGFAGFVVIYTLHGVFTGFSHRNIWLFLLYGPASRLVMALLLLVGLLSYKAPPDPVARRADLWFWISWLIGFFVIDLFVAVLAYSPVAGSLGTRLSMEGGALAVSLVNVGLMLWRRIRSPLMLIFGISVMSFALSSLAFILGKPWNHMWWLAHAIFASGFFLLSFGVVQAFHTTRSFSTIYSQDELMARLGEAMARTEAALQELQHTNQKLEHLAAIDPLTGAVNRRIFLERIETEIGRARRGEAPFSLLALDLDNFKRVNDTFGHQVGDSVLKGFVQTCLEAIRPYDGVARVGGEEFMVLLPQAALDAALMIGERIRMAIQSTRFDAAGGDQFSITVSIGISQFGQDGSTIDSLLRAADQRLYRAKSHGRNCVIAV